MARPVSTYFIQVTYSNRIFRFIIASSNHNSLFDDNSKLRKILRVMKFGNCSCRSVVGVALCRGRNEMPSVSQCANVIVPPVHIWNQKKTV